MKQLPVIRHLRYFIMRYCVDRHYGNWRKLGSMPLNAAHDYEILDQIWRGEI